MNNQTNIRLALAAAALAVTGCGGDRTGSDAESDAVEETAAGDAVHIPDACTFFAKAELETTIGQGLRDGVPQSVPDGGGSSCEFKRELGRHATKTFPSPALPTTVGFDSVVISTSSADPQAVAEVRQLDPAAFDDVAGLGDDAYFLGPGLLHVRVGSRGFSVRINADGQTPDDQAKVRQVVLALGEAGVSRL